MRYDRPASAILKTFYILTMTVAFTTRIADLGTRSNHLQMMIGMMWIAIAYAQFILNDLQSMGSCKDDLLWLTKAYFFPHLLIHLYTMILMILGKVPWRFMTTNVSVYIPTLLVISSIYLFGVRAIEYDLIALFGSWSIAVITSTIIKGPIIFYHAIMQAYIDPMIDMSRSGIKRNYLELHDLVLAIGYVCVYYILKKEKLTKRKIILILFTFLVMLLGMKRISILGIVLVLSFRKLTKWLSVKKQYMICLVSGWSAFVFCYLFIWILSMGPIFYEFASEHGINMMGRNYYFKAIMDLTRFSPRFLGLGRHVIAKLLETELSHLHVGGVHSDIIKMYAENGFVVFGIWLWYYLIHMTRSYKKHFGIDGALLYFGMTIYTFTLYLTDNTEIYFICQIFSITIPAVYAIKRKRELKKIAFMEQKVCKNERVG